MMKIELKLLNSIKPKLKDSKFLKETLNSFDNVTCNLEDKLVLLMTIKFKKKKVESNNST